jgi:hypothetical protein
MQRFKDAQDVDLERRRAERERQVRVIQDAMRNLNAPSNPNARTK